MSALQIEDRLAKLEADVADLKRHISTEPSLSNPWWEEVLGIFADDPDFESAMEIGRNYRQSCQQPSVKTIRGLAQWI